MTRKRVLITPCEVTGKAVNREIDLDVLNVELRAGIRECIGKTITTRIMTIGGEQTNPTSTRYRIDPNLMRLKLIKTYWFHFGHMGLERDLADLKLIEEQLPAIERSHLSLNLLAVLGTYIDIMYRRWEDFTTIALRELYDILKDREWFDSIY